MSHYDHLQQPPASVPPPQGNPEKDPHPPPEHTSQGYPPQQGPAPQYVQNPIPPGQEIGFLERCLTAICCCCLVDGCCI